MIALKPYPTMKDSGVPWLGKVPIHWEVLPNRAIFSEVIQRDHPDEQMLSVTITKGVIRQQALLADSSKKDSSNQDKSAYKLVRPGDIVYNKMRAWQGAVGVSNHRGIVSPAYVVQRPRVGADSRYLHYLFRTLAFAKEAERWSYGITSDMWSLRPEHFKMIYTCLPPYTEQAAIVRFLDQMDRRIQRYIHAKQKLIKLLEEQKQVIIHRAVTRGLDPNVRLKPSGVAWLGDVPVHWEIAALRHRYSQCLGKMLDSKRITGNHSLPYLRNTDVQWDRINIENLPTMDIPPAEYTRYTVQWGDLLVCEGGEVGRCAIWSDELLVCGFQKALHRLRPLNASRDVPRFMYYALRAAAKGNAFNDGHLSTIAHLTGDKLRAHRFPFPPVEEQKSLVNFLDSALKEVDQAVSTALSEISLLREYRTSLIADIVTGKLDVRGVVLPTMDEAEAQEDWNEDADVEAGAIADVEETADADE
jgi:type I restriction enzyme, S subunit